MKKSFLCAMIAFALCSCQKDVNEPADAAEGKIAITTTVSGEVATRAEGITLPTPAPADFNLQITGTDFSKTWESLSDYRTDDERYLAGWYTVAIAYGDANAEGYNVPAFAASKDVEVLDRNRTTIVELTATLANAIVTINTTEAFDNYFPTSEFTITTATNTFEFDKLSTDHLYVAAQEGLKIDCSCIRQSNVAANKYEQLATQTIPTVAAATRYVITYDLTSAGSVTITIKLNQTIIDVIEVERELNPNA